MPALRRKPYIDDQPDLKRLMADFGMLSQTRQPGFNGPGTLRMTDILTLYHAQGWIEGDIEVMEYVRIMLFLDNALREYYEERRPLGK